MNATPFPFGGSSRFSSLLWRVTGPCLTFRSLAHTHTLHALSLYPARKAGGGKLGNKARDDQSPIALSELVLPRGETRCDTRVEMCAQDDWEKPKEKERRAGVPPPSGYGKRGCLLFASSQEVLTWATPQPPLSLAQFCFLMRQTQWILNGKPLSQNPQTGAPPFTPCGVLCRRLPVQQGSASGSPLEVRGASTWVAGSASAPSSFLPGGTGGVHQHGLHQPFCSDQDLARTRTGLREPAEGRGGALRAPLQVTLHTPPHLPSFHSLVAGLIMPNSSSQVTAFGSRSTATGFLFRF